MYCRFPKEFLFSVVEDSDLEINIIELDSTERIDTSKIDFKAYEDSLESNKNNFKDEGLKLMENVWEDNEKCEEK